MSDDKLVRISADLHYRVSIAAATERMTIKDVVEEAVEQWLEAEGPRESAVMAKGKHKSGQGQVVMKEGDRGYIVTVNKEGLPPHYSKEHPSEQEARKDFNRLSK
jgi:predicted transcriptional regulator